MATGLKIAPPRSCLRKARGHLAHTAWKRGKSQPELPASRKEHVTNSSVPSKLAGVDQFNKATNVWHLGEVKIEVFCDQVPKASEVSQSLAASHCAQARALA